MPWVPLPCLISANEPRELLEPLFGNNMAYRREVFEKYGGFRTELGPRPGSEIRSEDTELGQRLLSARERLRYEPSAIVYHAVPPNRIQKSYFLAWWFDKGRAEIRELGRSHRYQMVRGWGPALPLSQAHSLDL